MLLKTWNAFEMRRSLGAFVNFTKSIRINHTFYDFSPKNPTKKNYLEKRKNNIGPT